MPPHRATWGQAVSPLRSPGRSPAGTVAGGWPCSACPSPPPSPGLHVSPNISVLSLSLSGRTPIVPQPGLCPPDPRCSIPTRSWLQLIPPPRPHPAPPSPGRLLGNNSGKSHCCVWMEPAYASETGSEMANKGKEGEEGKSAQRGGRKGTAGKGGAGGSPGGGRGEPHCMERARPGAALREPSPRGQRAPGNWKLRRGGAHSWPALCPPPPPPPSPFPPPGYCRAGVGPGAAPGYGMGWTGWSARGSAAPREPPRAAGSDVGREKSKRGGQGEGSESPASSGKGKKG